MSKNTLFLQPENLPDSATLIIPGRLDHSQMLRLAEKLSKRKIIWLCEENVVLDPQTEQHLKQTKAEAVAFSLNDPDLSKVGDNLRQDLGDHGVAVFLPGKVNAIPGTACHIPGTTLKALCELKLPTTPLTVHVAAETSLTTVDDQMDTIFVFEPTIPANKVNPAKWMQALHHGNSVAFSQRDFLKESLTYNLLKGLKKHSSSKIFDGSNDTERSYLVILGMALALASHIKEHTKKKRVAIILPPGTGGLVANLAVLFAGKIPVNLNFTASHEAIKSSIKQADVDKFITADPFVRKMSDFPWPALRDMIHVERLLPQLKKSIKRWVIVCKIFPASLIAKFAGISKKGGDQEAVLLFTSGSSGEPKGVPLTHANLLANVCQFGARLSILGDSTILGCLPLFHSFGSTATLWFPIIEGINLVTYPSPLESKRLADLIEMHDVKFVLSTPTFLRGYMRRVKPEQFKSVKLIVTGAEKLPCSLAQSFYDKFGLMPQEGYGLTETSPATNFNFPIINTDTPEPDIDAARKGTVGQILPGIAVKVTNAATDEESDIDQSGIIWFKGANIFAGYLNEKEKSAEVLVDGWFKTGDVGKVDHDGFLTIEGRISRFSKIAGEMVPHETLEAAITQVLDLDGESERKIAVVGVPDEQRGESIMLLSCITDPESTSQACTDLRYKLLDHGIPSMWCPREIIIVDEIPVLASGKLDMKGCENLVTAIYPR